MDRLEEYRWFHRLRGHTITVREALPEDDCLMFTVGRFGHITPIILEVCDCGVAW